MMQTSELEQWRATYRATAEALETIRARELAALTDAEALRQIKSLCMLGPVWRERPEWSGLVEQQALFQRCARNYHFPAPRSSPAAQAASAASSGGSQSAE